MILGALLFVSPWLLSRSFASARADAFAGGALLVLVSLLAIAAFREWEERINLAIGCWILASPFLLHFPAQKRHVGQLGRRQLRNDNKNSMWY